MESFANHLEIQAISENDEICSWIGSEKCKDCICENCKQRKAEAKDPCMKCAFCDDIDFKSDECEDFKK